MWLSGEKMQDFSPNMAVKRQKCRIFRQIWPSSEKMERSRHERLDCRERWACTKLLLDLTLMATEEREEKGKAGEREKKGGSKNTWQHTPGFSLPGQAWGVSAKKEGTKIDDMTLGSQTTGRGMPVIYLTVPCMLCHCPPVSDSCISGVHTPTKHNPQLI